MSTASPAGWSNRCKRSQTIELEEEMEINDATTPTAKRQAPQAMFARYRGDLQSAIGGLNGRDLSHVAEGTRIALRQDAEGQWAWAFVPLATLDEGVRDEGTWPRVVNVMGDVRIISRDEWDQYKCDTQQFQCHISLPPGVPIVKLRDNSRATPLTPPSPSPVPERIPRSSRKRRLSGTGFATNKSIKRTKTEEPPSKRPQVVIDLADDISHISASSDDDVEEVIYIRPQRPPHRSKPNSKGKERDRQGSPPGLDTLYEQLNRLGIPIPTTSPSYLRGTSKPPEMKTSMDTDPAAQVKRRQSSDHDRSNAKRARRLSPDTLKRDVRQKLREHKWLEEQRRQRLGNSTSTPLQTTSGTKHHQPNERDFWSSVDFSSLKGQQFDVEESSAPQGPAIVFEVNDDEEGANDETDESKVDEGELFYSSEPETLPTETQPEEELDPDRLAAIEESKRKLAELEKDRPIWEAAELKRVLAETQRRLREEKERADRLARKEQERKVRAEELAEQARQRAKRQREEEARRKNWADGPAQAQKKAQEARRKLAEEAERLREQQRRSEWTYFEEFLGTGGWQYGTGSTRFPGWGGAGGPSSYPRGAGASPGKSANPNGWTPRKALDRYHKLAAEFDMLRVSEASPLDMSKVPWPVLHTPGYKLAQVDWSSVEAFFSQAELLSGGKKSAAWKELLKSSARRFHPDRWRARGLIGPHGGGQEVEERVNDVAKVLNPLYKEVS